MAYPCMRLFENINIHSIWGNAEAHMENYFNSILLHLTYLNSQISGFSFQSYTDLVNKIYFPRGALEACLDNIEHAYWQ